MLLSATCDLITYVGLSILLIAMLGRWVRS